MATITKSGEAPEGTIHAGVGAVGFKVTDDKPYETDDLAVIEYAQKSKHLEVDLGDQPDTQAAAREEAKALKELAKAQEKAEKQRATKAPSEAPAPKPASVDELEAQKNDGGKS